MKTIFTTSLCLFALLAALAAPANAQEVRGEIRKEFLRRIPLMVQPFTADKGTSRENTLKVEQVVTQDLEFSGLFQIYRFQIASRGQSATEGLIEVRGRTTLHGSDVYFEGSVIDAESGQVIGAKRYRMNADQTRAIAHHFSDEIVKMLTGEEGIAKTQILFRRKIEDKWELVLCDYDGYNPRVLLRQTVPVLYPRWIDNNRAVTYTSFRYGKPDLFVRILKESESRKLATFEGVNYAVDWSDARKEMVATLSKDGNAELYLLAKDGTVKRRLTHSRSIETSPSWAPTGREIVFTSDRIGTPQIYVMGADGTNVRRLTFQGNYNESPCWSPKGDLITFVSRIDGFFQLCTIRPDGSEFAQLTGGAVNHEDPRWAPNGRHIVFSEYGGGEHSISIIDIGTGGKRILSRGETPDWSVH